MGDINMLTPVRKDVFRWGTPDPEAEWVMFGHLIVNDSKCTLIDPPLIPGLLEAVQRMGKVDGVALTTLDHTRGAAYIARKTGATLYLPDQNPGDVDPRGYSIMKEMKDFEKFSSGKVLGLRVYGLSVPGNSDIGMPSVNEFAFLTDQKELIVGDFAVGSESGKVLVAPEWFPGHNPNPVYQPAHNELRNLVKKTGAVSLLASHGHDLYGTLQVEAERL